MIALVTLAAAVAMIGLSIAITAIFGGGSYDSGACTPGSQYQLLT